MQPEQKKKVFIMAGALGLLVIAACLFFFLSKGSGSGDSPTTPTATSPAPAAPSPVPSAPPSTPSTGAPVPTPTAGAVPTAPTMASATTSSIMPAVDVVVDPFLGCPAKQRPPKNRSKSHGVGAWNNQSVYMEKITPIPAIPGVSPVTDPGPTGGNNGGDTGFDIDPFGAAPTQRNLANANLGRNAGWISSETQGRVTAYFDLGNGAIQPINVGSVINGWRVKAIYKEYIVLTEETTGREEKVLMQGAKPAQTQSMTTGSRITGWD